MTFCEVVLFFIMSLKKMRSNFSLTLPNLPGHFIYFLKNTCPKVAFNQTKLPGILGSQTMQYHLCGDNFFQKTSIFPLSFCFQKYEKHSNLQKSTYFTSIHLHLSNITSFQGQKFAIDKGLKFSIKQFQKIMCFAYPMLYGL